MTVTTEPTTGRRRPTDAAADDETLLGKEASRAVRSRSMRLLGDLLRSHKRALAWAAVLVVASTLGQVAGSPPTCTSAPTTPSWPCGTTRPLRTGRPAPPSART